MKIAALVLALAAVAAGALAWHERQELASTRDELGAGHGQLQKARAELQTVQNELAALRGEAAAAKLAMDQMQADLSGARNFLEAEKAVSARLRDDLANAKAQLAAASSRRPVQTVQPMAISPKPAAMRAAPGGSTAVRAGSAAR